jgi:hypothetical protein
MRDALKTMDEKKQCFMEWYDYLEGFSYRSERAIDDIYYAVETRNPQLIEQWLYAAFEAGYEEGKK